MSAQRLNIPRAMRRVVCLVAATAALVSWAAAQNRELSGSAANVPNITQPVGNTAPAVAGANAKPTERLREGTRLIDVTGTFQSIGGENVSFSPGGKDAFRVLENLALQRVSQVLDENKGARQWTVSGMITEYRGANFLLITKAAQLEGDSATSQ